MRGIVKDYVYYKNEKETGKLKMCGGAWSINLDEILGVIIKKIVYVTSKSRYEISYDEAMERGFHKIFGGENKLVVPEKYWTTSQPIDKQNK
jgi:hypothetical protein